MQQFDDLILNSQSLLIDAMIRIDRSGRGICFIVEDERVIGVITDGDIRRHIIAGRNIHCDVCEVMNKDFISLPVTSSADVVRSCFARNLRVVPLIDRSGKLVDFADAYTNHLIPVIKPSLGGKELEYLTECITTNWVSSKGAFIQRFEQLFSRLHNDRPAITTSSGTTALHLALIALGIGEGDEVIIPDITFAASANAVLYCNANPVLCEIEKQSLCIDIDKAQSLVTSRTKAIMPVHLYGHACDMTRVMQFAKKNALKVVEDCAESLGTKWDGKIVGTFGDAAAFSFFGNKTVTTGEGGMILFKDERICAEAKELRDHGMSVDRRYWHNKIGFNYRMTNLQAALGLAQLERFEDIIYAKRRVGMSYINMLSSCKKIAHLPHLSSKVVDTFWLFTIIFDQSVNRDTIIDKLRGFGIETRPVFFPLHTMPPYQACTRSADLSVAEWSSLSGLSLPSSIELDQNEITYICQRLMEALS